MRPIGTLIQNILDSIIRQEGMPSNYTNPGNLRAAPWLKPPLNGVNNGFWQPHFRMVGIAGAAHVIALHIAEGNSLTQLISIWAPITDGNNTAAYIKNVSEWANIPDVEVPLWTLVQA